MQSTRPVRQEVTVNCTPERAFDVFTHQFQSWWPASHHVGEGELAEVRIEPWAGGRWYELNTRGTECDWGYVLAWDPPAGLDLAWQLSAEFRYDPDLLTRVAIRFTEIQPGRTRVVVEHGDLDQYGLRSMEMRETFLSEGGWPGLIASFAEAAQA